MRRSPLLVAVVAAGTVALVALVALDLEGRTSMSRGDSTAFEGLVERAEAIDGLRSLLAWRDGELLLEGHFDRAGREDLHHLRSATKSVTGLLVGIALEEGLLASVDLTLGEVLGDDVARLGGGKADLTVEQLLTMSAGLEWNESDDVGEYNRLRSSRDPLAHYLERPFAHRPGSTWAYSSGASHALSVALSAATGEELSAFARSRLFEPLGIDRFRWESMADGHTNGSAGLELRSLDTLKLGILVLQGGVWNDKQIVPREWVATSTRPLMTVGGDMSYGYQWWVVEDGPITAWMALGYAGQMLLVLPDVDAVVVSNCQWRGLGRSPAEQSSEVQRFVQRELGPLLAPELADELSGL